MSQVDRRAFLQKAAVTGAAVGGAAWAAPSVLGFQQAFAAGSTPPSVTGGGYVWAAGNSPKSVTLPTGSLFVLVVSTTKVNPITNIVVTGGWTPLGDNTSSGAAPSLFAYWSTSPAATTVTDNNVNNDTFGAQVYGFTGVTTVVLGAFATATGTSLSVPGVTTGSANGEYVLFGTSVDSAGGWNTPSGYSLVNYGSQSQKPDIQTLLYSSRATSAPATTLTHTSAAAAGVIIGAY